MPYRPKSRPPRKPPTCPALLWDSGRACGREPDGSSPYCRTHRLILEPVPEPAGYATQLDPSTHDFYRHGATLTLGDEIALIRFQILKLLAQDAPARDIVRTISMLTAVVRLQRLLTVPSRRRKR